MLNNIVEKIEEEITEKNNIKILDKLEAVRSYYPYLLQDFYALLQFTEEKLNNHSLFNEFQIKPYEIESQENCKFFGIKIIPNEKYFEYLNENMEFLDHIKNAKNPGLMLDIALFIYPSINEYEKIFINFSLDIPGRNEIIRFNDFFSNYKRLFQILFSSTLITFEANDRINADGYNYNEGTFFSLIKFFEIEPEEHSFSFNFEFYKDTSLKELLYTFSIICAIWNSFYFYMKEDKKLDKILEYFYSLEGYKINIPILD